MGNFRLTFRWASRLPVQPNKDEDPKLSTLLRLHSRREHI